MSVFRSDRRPGRAALLAFLAAVSAAGAEAPTPEAVDALFRPASPAAEKPEAPSAADARTPDKALADVLQRLDAVETRLGNASRPPSAAYSVERRLADLEKRVQQIEQQLARMPQFDQRIRRLETKQP